jgi:hypothetical protein
VVSPVPPKRKASFADGKVTAADAQFELQRLVASPDFSASARRKALLTYLVEQTLEGGAGKLKEFSIALAVFGRDETFDPRADPVVRLEARRLRNDLDEFYHATGRDHPIRIMIPKGSYRATFEPQRPEGKPPSLGAARSPLAALMSAPGLGSGSVPPR